MKTVCVPSIQFPQDCHKKHMYFSQEVDRSVFIILASTVRVSSLLVSQQVQYSVARAGYRAAEVFFPEPSAIIGSCICLNLNSKQSTDVAILVLTTYLML